nr:reverse transcriptase domain-containing protein [Tanacetum cinerariifolium]
MRYREANLIIQFKLSSVSSSRLTRDQIYKQKVKNSNLEEHLPLVVTMADNRTMTELLRAPTEGYAEAIVVPPILVEQFKLKHSLINMMTTDQFFRLEKDNPHDHIRWFNKITSTIKYRDVPKYKDLLRACPHHGFTELHQLNTFYNALNPADQDSLNAAAGGILLERSTQDVLTIIKNKSKQTSAVTTAMTAMLKKIQATPSPASVKAVEEICVTCRRLGSLPSNTVANPKGKLKAITTRHGLVTDGPTIPTPSKSITPKVDERVEETYTDPDLAEYTIKVPPPPKMLKSLLSNKEKLQELANTPLNENCSAVILKKLPEKLGDPGKFLILCGFIELKCKALADLGASINLMPLSVWKKLGRPFLRTARALIDVHGEEMILHDGDERLTLNMKHDTSSYSNQPQRESINLINIFYVSSEDFLEEFTDKLALITYPSKYDDNLQFDIKSNLKEIEFMIYQDKDSSLKDSINQKGLANLNAIFVDPIPEMFIDEHTLDYSSPPKFDV